MIKLTKDFINKRGFVLEDKIKEDGFYYETYINSNLQYEFKIYFDFYDFGKEAIQVYLGEFELENVGQKELDVLLNMIPKYV